MTPTVVRRLESMRSSRDGGSALVLSVLVVLMVGTGLAIALDYAGVGLTLAPSVRDARNEANYVQGAVEGAIDEIRGSSEIGREDVATCPTFTPPTAPTGLAGVSGKTFSVTCASQPTGSSTTADIPRFAIHALGTGNEGILQDAGNGELYINGGIYSSGKIVANNTGRAALRVNGTITARNGCSGVITTTDPVGRRCTAPASAFDGAPNYSSAFADNPSLLSIINTPTSLERGADPVPTCAAGKAEFEPGYYQLNPEELLTRTLPTCNRSVFHFKPGVYYFDYPGVWDVGPKKVIGGTYLSSTLGAACDHEDDATPAPGVQFVFGGHSRIHTDSSSGGAVGGIELCGPEKGHALNGGPQRIALYALSSRDSLASPVPTSAPSTLTYAAGPTSTSTPDSFLLPTNAQTIDGVLRANTAPLLFGPGDSATLTYAPMASTVAKGSTVDAVRVKVAHVLVDTNASLQLSWPDGSTAGPVNVKTCPAAGCDITALVAARDVTWRSLAEMTITYKADAQPGTGARSAIVDGIELAVTSRAPGLRAISCNAAPCTFLDSDSNPNVFFHGTVYAPTAGFDVWIHNSGRTIFDRGVVVRTISINMNASSKQETAPFQLPRGTPDGRHVLFVGRVDDVEKVRACVRYVDQAPSASGASAYAGWSLSVTRWLVLRTPSAHPASCT